MLTLPGIDFNDHTAITLMVINIATQMWIVAALKVQCHMLSTNTGIYTCSDYPTCIFPVLLSPPLFTKKLLDIYIIKSIPLTQCTVYFAHQRLASSFSSGHSSNYQLCYVLLRVKHMQRKDRKLNLTLLMWKGVSTQQNRKYTVTTT
jgi:hypothetical protein